ncbi:MAG TPA: hypothetical protein VM911_18290 [Pyrinomonadaceae bacterium]|jgi:hypothetical protein|nr:hypothetical protein [Pyrinomonadaceae bacterium]
MKRFTNFLSWYRASIATVCGLGAVYLSDYFSSRFRQGISLFLVLVLIVIVFRVLEGTLEWAVNTFPDVRRLIFGRDFIEGWWFNVVLDKDPSVILFGALIHIEYNDNQFKMSGDGFTAVGVKRATMHSLSSVYSDSCLRYSYELMALSSETTRLVGYGENQFDRGDSVPHSYSGYFFDGFNNLVRVEGERITDRQITNQFHQLEKRVEAVKTHIQKYQKRGYTVVGSHMA